MDDPSKPLLAMGDFNSRSMELGDSISNSKGSMLCSRCLTHNLLILNRRDLLGVGTRQDSVLDLALTNKPDLFSMTVDMLPLETDHKPITVSCTAPAPPRDNLDTTPKWVMTDADWEGYNHECFRQFSAVEQEWTRLLEAATAASAQLVLEQANSELVSLMSLCATDHVQRASQKQRVIRRYHRLYGLLVAWKRMRGRLKRAKKVMNRVCQRGENADIAKQQLVRASAACIAARKRFDQVAKQLREKDWLVICQTVESKPAHLAFKAWRRTVPSSNLPLNSCTLRSDAQLPSSTKDSLNNVANFYSAVMSTQPIPEWNANAVPQPPPAPTPFDKVVTDTIASPATRAPCGALDDPISLFEVMRACKGLGGSTAAGPDCVPSLFIKKAPYVVHRILCLMFNVSWRFGVLPRSWRHALAFCLHKPGGSRVDPSSYRIICITSILIRCFERIVKERLVKHLEARNFFSLSQAGFRHSLSTLDHLYLLKRDVHNAMRQNKQLPVVFLDIVKAFDRVPHDRLLYKLFTQGGISGRAWLWVRAFLSDRTFRVTQGAFQSDVVSATAGVPQGAVLSPLLFIVYINDIATDCPLRIHQSLFADDIAAWPTGKLWARCQYRQLRLYLQHVDEWSTKWRLRFSVKKSGLVIFSHKLHPPDPPSPPLRLANRRLPRASKYKYLGHILSRKLAYQTHYAAVKQKTWLTAHYIARVTSRWSTPSPHVIARLVKAVLVPQMTYGQALIPFTVDYTRSLTQLIARPLRRSLGLPRSSSAQRVLWEFGLYDLHTLHLKSIIDFAMRSQRCLDKGIPLASQLAADCRDYVPITSPKYCTPFPQLVLDALAALRLPKLPDDKLELKTALDAHALRVWTTTAKASAVAMKPSLKPPMYLFIDSKPAVCIRARVRLGVALSFARLFLFRKRDSASCAFCGLEGTIEHLLMVCPRFHTSRSACRRALERLRPPFTLSMEVLCGKVPVDVVDRAFKKTLPITARFLLAVSKVQFL